MEPQGRARGRAGRGRARGQQSEGGMRRPGEGTAPQSQPTGRATPSYAQMGAQGGARPQQPPPQSAWGPPPSGRATHRGSASRPPGDVAGAAAQVQQMSIHDAGSSAGGSVGSGSASGSGPVGREAGGNGAAPVGRGAMRGRRVITEMVHTRPQHVVSKQGTGGAPVKLRANYFKLETVTDWCLYQYRVDFAPEEDRTIVRKGLLRHHKEILGGFLFDGTVLFTSHRLSPDPMTLTSARTSDGVIFTITVRLVGDLARGDFHYIQFFNILMRKCLDTLKLQLVGRDYYDAQAKVEVREFKLELWPGYKTSIRQHESDILMCAEVTFKVMRQETVFQVLDAAYRRDSVNWKRIFMDAVIGCVVLTDYNNKTYRVDDVDFTHSPQHTFDKKGEQISYIKYYQDRYQIRIKDATQPMLVSRSKARDIRAGMSETVYLIPELCRMTGLTDDMRNNFQLMKALAVHTRVAPNDRMRKLLAFSERLRTNQQCISDLNEWNMRLSSQLVDVPGRELPIEKIILGGGATTMPDQRFDWTNGLRSNPMLSLKSLDKWVVVVLGRMKNDAKSFVDILMKAARGMRFNIAQPMVKEIPDDRAGTYVQTLTQILDQCEPQLIMCILVNNRGGDRYSAIKKKCCVDRAVPTQVIVAKNLTSKGVMSIATKVAIQMNCKIGGSPWSVEVPLSGLMVVGFDVCHDTANKSQSYGAMVASLDKAMSRYYSAVSAHQSGEELSNDLSLNLIKAVRKFQEVNKTLPERILIYRDGVGEGQLPYVFTHEVEKVKEKLSQAYSGQDPKMSYIIVTKRINTRIFSPAGNPRSGTVVDDVITDPTKYDFYIVSQSVNQGTVAPTSYNVLHDTVGLNADKIQRLTYKLCHMYFNWSGTVRVPAPCQYAHKLAFLVGQSLHREPSTGLEDLLYFL